MNIKETICKEIERLDKHYIVREYDCGWNNALVAIRDFLDSLPEQPVEGLEKEVISYLNEYSKANEGYPSVDEIARHFAEWGTEQKSIEIFKKQNCQGCGTQRCMGDDEWLEGCKAFQAWKVKYLKK